MSINSHKSLQYSKIEKEYDKQNNYYKEWLPRKCGKKWMKFCPVIKELCFKLTLRLEPQFSCTVIFCTG